MALPFIYTPDVPQGTQQINNTQQPINYNFQDISSLMSVNHIGFNTADTFGTHNFINYYNQTSQPTTGSSELAIFSQNTGSGLQLYYRYPNSGSSNSLTQPYYGSTAGTATVNVASAPNSSAVLYLNGNIKCTMALYTTPTTNTPTTATFYYYPYTVFQNTPFAINISCGFMSTSPTNNLTYPLGITGVQPINNTTFSIDIDSKATGTFYVMALGV